MNREIIEVYNGKIEVVYNDDGYIVFAKKTSLYRGFRLEDDMTTVSGYGLVTDMHDVGFTHLQLYDFPQGAIVDFQYIDGNPKNAFSDAKIGTLKVYLGRKLIAGESFRPDGFDRIELDGQLIEDPNGISMSAPKSVKEVVGKHISDIRTAGKTI